MMATTISPFGDHLCFISPCRFDHLRQRHQALANCFAETGTRVTYVNPIGSAGFSLRRQRFGESLQIFDLTVPFRATQHPGLQRITCLAAKRLLQLHGEWSPRNSHLWLADPAWCSWTTAPWQKIYYDRCDRHGFFPRQCREAWLHYELSLYKLSHIIFCTSKV
ncbi:MAG TPA: hypothetical protein PKO06_09935, partial [Candidatus Ozemobacteraceae bacterium]|nr:hypothetical protein [Candidatus Ozemobacteraceae bacterium]